MIAIVTVLFAFPLGWFVRSRFAAYVGYVAVYGYAFTFPAVYLLRGWIGDRSAAFPRDPDQLPVGYLFVTALIYAAGFGLVILGHWARHRRPTRQPGRSWNGASTWTASADPHLTGGAPPAATPRRRRREVRNRRSRSPPGRRRDGG